MTELSNKPLAWRAQLHLIPDQNTDKTEGMTVAFGTFPKSPVPNGPNERHPMSADRETQLKSRPFMDRIVELPDWRRVIEGREPKWIGQLLSTLILATNGEELIYLTGEYANDETETKARLIVFTGRLVVTADILGKPGEDEADIAATVRSRRSLTSYTVNSDESIYGAGIADRWPGNVTAELTYAGGTLINIPLTRATSATSRAEIYELAQSLSADLNTAV